MWEHFDADEVRRRLDVLQRYCDAGVPNPGNALAYYWYTHGDIPRAREIWNRFAVETTQSGQFVFAYGSEPKEGYGGALGGRARHPLTPLAELAMFAHSQDPDTRGDVGSNPAAPAELLRELANDPELEVRLRVLGNPACPPDLLRTNMWVRIDGDDEYPSVTWGAISGNPSCPLDVLYGYMDGAENWDEDEEGESLENLMQFTLNPLAQNLSLPTEDLRPLSQHWYNWVRWGVAGNPITPVEILAELMHDPDSLVKSTVSTHLNLPDGAHSQVASLGCEGLDNLLRGSGAGQGGEMDEYQAGMDAYNLGDTKAAAEHWTIAVESGNSRAAYNLGVILEDQGETREAIAWLIKASELGDPDAALNVAQLYTDLEEDADALKWYLAAAESGDVEAYGGAGLACWNASDSESARVWWLKAAEHGDAIAMCNLGVLEKIAEDFDSARQWFEKSSALGYSEADENLELLDAIEYEDEGTTDFPKYEALLTEILEGVKESASLSRASAAITRFSELASEIMLRDQETPEANEMHELAKRIDYLARQEDRIVDRVLLRSMILLLPWPPYEKGDGYWSAPSKAATNVALDAKDLSLEDIELVNALQEALGDAMGFTDLGVVSNPAMPHTVVHRAAHRKSPETGTRRPPVMVVAAAHKNMYPDDAAALVEDLSDEDGLNWVSHLIGHADGWMWPDWQYAFGEITPLVERSPAFWSAVLKTQPGSTCALAEFEEEQGIDPEFYDECLNDLTEYVAESPKMRALVEASGWEPGLALLER